MTTLRASPTDTIPGGTVTASWAGLVTTGNDWISLHPAGAPDTTYLTLKSITAGPNGTITFTAPTIAGSYDLRLFANGTKVATSDSFDVVTVLTASPSVASPGGTVTATWGGLVSTGNDWISLHPAGAPDTSYLTFQSITGPAGSITFTAPTPAGSYDLRLFAGGTKVATSNPFSVVAITGPEVTGLVAHTVAQGLPGDPTPVAYAGDTVTLTGSGFAPGSGPAYVHFGSEFQPGSCAAAAGVPDASFATNTSECVLIDPADPSVGASDGSVTVHIPEGATTGGSGEPAGQLAVWITTPAGVSGYIHLWVRNTYLAMGDSFSSGEGVSTNDTTIDPANAPAPADAFTWEGLLSPVSEPPMTFLNGVAPNFKDNCHRSKYAYSALLSADFPNLRYQFVACSGAVIRNMAQLYDDQPPQSTCDGSPLEWPCPQYPLDPLQIGKVNKGTGLITVTAGGNDLGFAPILGFCAFKSCSYAFQGLYTSSARGGSGLEDMTDNNIRAMYPRLVNFYGQLRQESGNAPVYVLGYPHLFNVGIGRACAGTAFSPTLCTYFDDATKQWFTSGQEELDVVMQEAAARAGVHFVEMGPSFDGHTFGTQLGAPDWTNTWINYLSLINESGANGPGIGKFAFHPDAAGHQSEYQTLVAAGIDQLTPNPRPDDTAPAPPPTDHWWTLDTLDPPATGKCGIAPWCVDLFNNSFDLWPAPMDPTTGEVNLNGKIPAGTQVDEQVARSGHCENGFTQMGGFLWHYSYYYCGGTNLDPNQYPDLRNNPPVAPWNAPALVPLSAPAADVVAGTNYGFTVPGGSTLQMRASNLLAGSSAGVSVLSTPQYLGSATVGADGTFTLDVALPLDLPGGSHTLVLDGTSATGQAVVLRSLFNVSTPAPGPTPTIVSHPDVVIDAASPDGAVVRYLDPMARDSSGVLLSVSCLPASPRLFPIGTTTVNCTTTDKLGNSAQSSFSVRVKGTAAVLADLRQLVAAQPTLSATSNDKLLDRLDQAIATLAMREPALEECKALRKVRAEIIRSAREKKDHLPLSLWPTLISSEASASTSMGCPAARSP